MSIEHTIHGKFNVDQIINELKAVGVSPLIISGYRHETEPDYYATLIFTLNDESEKPTVDQVAAAHVPTIPMTWDEQLKAELQAAADWTGVRDALIKWIQPKIDSSKTPE
ncbi:hypothetical protein ACFO25_09870 [Paenactinomyces guangxiensis]|uniref:Uncharacterized protein n=1 Tax=Paenactinomyces guangxiensis TaxID=1490290 RepID=A0A7W2A808_9BACL|nr:hypothetical protein [Paenactinomyces guangxiensis]MBA4495091.1 hypothetical protein [Paenactinomyces guangxiensis]MBH8592225.1 hypothetical protein [Paenactinomyces guangxiensis]